VKTPFIARLQVAAIHKCGICETVKTLNYVVMDDKCDTFGICEECKDKISKEHPSDDNM